MDTKAWRTSKGLNISKGALVLGISQPSLSRIEAGDQWPEPETIERIVKNSGNAVNVTDLHASFMAARRARAAEGKAA